jgi:hypothetical protein
MHPHEAYKMCKEHKHQYVRIHMKNGKSYDGFIDRVDSDYVGLAMPYEMEEGGESFSLVRRRFGFRRRLFPLAGLAALSLIPFIGGGYPYYPPFGYFPYGSSFY